MAMYGSDLPSIKVEAANAENDQRAAVKSEPESAGASPAGLEGDADIYEDTGDLDFSDSNHDLYLTRLPKFLWDDWLKLGDDEEIEIGRIRIEGQPGDIKRMSMELKPEFARARNVPVEYNLHITNKSSNNTFVFSEKEQPRSQFRSRPYRAHIDARKSGRIGKLSKDEQWIRRTVPKQTALAGHIKTELNCLPVENADYERIMKQRQKLALALKPKQEIQYLDHNNMAGGGGNILAPGLLGAAGELKSFTNKAGPAKGKKTMIKAARMPQNELLDLIYDCFKEYTYWPFRSLKDRLRQPDTYLKETLEMVAVMLRTGTHASQWQLKPEAREGRYAESGLFDKAKEEAAPDAGPGLSFDGVDDMEEDDEDMMEMEDVLP